MDLKKFLPNREEKSAGEFLWALIIEPGWVSAGIWKIESSQAQVTHTSTPFSWELDEELINACDAALSSIIQDFPPEEKEPTKVVFGVTSGWVSGGEIKQEYLEKIKSVCAKLSLTPVGFVVLAEAIAHLIKSEEGTPANAVLLGLHKEGLEVTVFKLGKLSGTTQVARSVSLVDDCVEGLSRFSGEEPVPSRFVIYDGREGELEDSRQAILQGNWEDLDKIKLLHTPKVEIIDNTRKVNAVCLAGASEIANVTDLVHVPAKELHEETPSETFEKDFAEEEISPEELGFALDKDVAEDLVKVSGEDMADMAEIHEPEPVPEPVNENKYTDNVVPVHETESGNKPKRFDFKKFDLSFISVFLGKIPKPKFNFRPQMPSLSGGRPILFGVIFLILIAIAGLFWWWFVPKANLTIYVSPKSLDEKVLVKVDLSRDSSSIGERILAGKVIDSTSSGEKTKDTTGTKTVGEKAKGEIMIYRVGTELNLQAGTAVNGPGSLKFTLDDQVKVASGSAGTPGKTKATVSADDIGSEYNLASGTTFTVGNYSTSDMEAKNESSFSGGTSRDISAVSKEDQEALLSDLTDELKEDALSGLKSETSESQFFIESSVDATPSSKLFSSKVGDEAKTLKLSLDVKANGVAVVKDELAGLAQEALKEKIPPRFVLRKEQISYEFQKPKVSGKVYEFEVRISVNLLPEIKTDEIREKIKGKIPQVADEYFNKEVPGFARAEIKITPALFGKLKTLPHIAKNIDVEIAAER